MTEDSPASLLAPRLILAVAAAGLAVAIGLDAGLTASGIAFLGIAVPLPFVGRAAVPIAYAFVLGCTALAAELVLAAGVGRHRWRRRLVVPAAAFIALLAVQSVGAALHGIQILNLAQGERLQRSLALSIQDLTSSALAADRSITMSYRHAISSERGLGAQSAAGLDETRDPRCGPLCRGAYRTARLVEGRYANLSLPIDRNTFPSTETAAEAYARLEFILGRLRTKSKEYLGMCRLLQWPCNDPIEGLIEGPTYRRVVEAFSGSILPDRQSLVLRIATADVGGLLRGNPSLFVALVLIFVMALPAAELGLVLFLRTALALLREAPDAALDDARRRSALLDEQIKQDLDIALKQAARRACADDAFAKQRESEQSPRRKDVSEEQVNESVGGQ